MLLEVEDLEIRYGVQEDGQSMSFSAVEDVGFSIEQGEIFGLVGESGCGKSTVANGIMRVLPHNGEIANGAVRLNSQDMTNLSKNDLRKVRWEEISLISQSAMNAFDPVYTIGEQLREVIREHRDMNRSDMNDRISELLELVGIDPERANEYPHQFSGGMKQRAVIAMSLILDPDIIIADEPTTALDVISQDTILHHLETIQEETGVAILIITHDMSVVAEMCDRIGVMYAGKLVEVGTTETVFNRPLHPYTLGLREAFPTVHQDASELISIPGSPPDLTSIEDHCRFASRCPFAQEQCYEQDPPTEDYGDNHEAACLRIDELGPEELRSKASKPSTWTQVGWEEQRSP